MFARMIFVFIFICFFAPFVCFCEEKVTIKTYYPTPVGVYNQVTAITLASQVLSVGDINGDTDIDDADVPDITTAPGRAWILGRTGVGTNSPEALLHVSWDSAPSNRSIAVFESGPTAGDVQFHIKQEYGVSSFNAIELMAQDGTLLTPQDRQIILNPGGGNVGVGETNPQAALDVNGDMSIDRILQINIEESSPAVCDADNKGVITFDSAANVFKGCRDNLWWTF